MKFKKRKKSSRMHGRKMGTHGTGCRKNKRGSGQRGGKGMAGTGKRADQKKTLVQKKYRHSYFGKQGITSRKTKRDQRKRINLYTIEMNLAGFIEKKIAKKTTKGIEIDLKDYKILGKGDVKNKLIINCKEASQSVFEKVEKAGGKIISADKKEIKQEKQSE